MAVRIATSDPKPSARTPDYDYFYFNKQTPSGGECAALIPRSLRGIVKRGFTFDDVVLRFDADLKASILELDFDESPVADPALPADPDTGWHDPDHPTALQSADPDALVAVAQRHGVIPNQGLRPATIRKRNAAARAAEHNLEVDLLLLLDQVCSAFNYASKRIGCGEKPRAMEAQKLATTALIPWLKNRGTDLTDEDEKAMTF